MNLLLWIVEGIIRRLRAWMYRFRGAKISRPCWLQQIDIPRNHFDISLGDKVALDRGVILLSTGERQSQPRILIGASTYINRYTMIDASESISIGANCMIGPFCYITDHDHGMQPGVPVNEQPLIGSPVAIEDDVWMGAHVTVLKGVTIHRGAVIGAGAVVTKNVPADAIVAGVPARVIGQRKNNNE